MGGKADELFVSASWHESRKHLEGPAKSPWMHNGYTFEAQSKHYQEMKNCQNLKIRLNFKGLVLYSMNWFPQGQTPEQFIVADESTCFHVSVEYHLCE